MSKTLTLSDAKGDQKIEVTRYADGGVYVTVLQRYGEGEGAASVMLTAGQVKELAEFLAAPLPQE